MSFKQKMDDHLGLFVSGLVLTTFFTTLGVTMPMINMLLINPKNEEIARLKENVSEEKAQINNLNQELEQIKKQLELSSGSKNSETAKSQTSQEKTPDSNTSDITSNKKVGSSTAESPKIQENVSPPAANKIYRSSGNFAENSDNPQPSEQRENQKVVTLMICDLTYQRATSNCPEKHPATYKVGEEPRQFCKFHSRR